MTLSEFLKLNSQQKMNGFFIQGDKTNGIYLSYFPNNKLEYKYSYKEGKLNGEFISNWEDGTLFYKGVYENGLKEGEWITRSRSGKSISRQKYHKGILIDEGEDTIL